MAENRLKYFITADHSDFEKGVNKAISVAKAGTQAIATGFATGAVAIAGMSAAAVGVAAAISEAGGRAREIQNMANLADMGSEAFQNYAYAVAQVGISSEKLGDISKDTREKLGEFISTGGGGFADFFNDIAPKVGLTAEKLQHLSGPDVLVAVKKAMDDANVSANQQTFYLESIASDASLLIPILQDGGAALKEQAARADELSLALSEVQVQNLIDAQQSVIQMTGVMTSLKDKTLAELAPAFTALTTGIIDGMADASGGIDGVAKLLAGKVIDSIDLIITGVEGVHVGWTMLKSAIPVVANAMVMATNLMFDGLRNLLFPLDAIFQALEEVADFMGTDFVNPLDTIQAKMKDVGKVTQGVMEESFQDIVEVKEGYEKLHGKIGDVRDNIGKLATQSVASGNVQRSEVEKTTSATVSGIDKVTQKAIDAEKKRYEASKAATDAKILKLNALAQADDSYVDSFVMKEQLKAKASKEASEDMVESYDDAAKDIQRTFGNELGDFFANSFDDIGDAWSSLWQGMVSIASQKIGEVVASFAASKLGDLLSTGVGSIFSFFHDGTMGLKNDEYNAVLQAGEIVIPKNESDQIRSAMGSSADFSKMVENIQVGSSLDRERLLAHVGVQAAAGTAISLGLQRLAGLPIDFVNQMKILGYNTTIGTFNGLMDLATTGVNPNYDSLFGPSAYSKSGSVLGGSAAAGMFGPIASVLGDVLGGLLGNAVGDILNDREFEDIRDAVESGMLDPQAAMRQMDARDRLAEYTNDYSFGSSFAGFFESISGFFDDIKSAFSGGGSDRSGSTGGGFNADRESRPGGMGGYAMGGLVNSLYVPAGDDGFAPLQFGEGVLSQRGMSNLAKLNGDGLGESGEVAAMRAELSAIRQILSSNLENTLKIAKTLIKIDAIGLQAR